MLGEEEQFARNLSPQMQEFFSEWISKPNRAALPDVEKIQKEDTSFGVSGIVTVSLIPYFFLPREHKGPVDVRGIAEDGFLLWYPLRGLMEAGEEEGCPDEEISTEGKTAEEVSRWRENIRRRLPARKDVICVVRTTHSVVVFSAMRRTDNGALYIRDKFIMLTGAGKEPPVSEGEMTFPKAILWSKFFQLYKAIGWFYGEKGRKPASLEELHQFIGSPVPSAWDEKFTEYAKTYLHWLKLPSFLP